MSSIASGMKHISRYEAPIWCVWNIDFIKWVNFNWVLKYVPIKLEQILGNFLKAETISNQRFFIRMDFTQLLHGVNLI